MRPFLTPSFFFYLFLSCSFSLLSSPSLSRLRKTFNINFPIPDNIHPSMPSNLSPVINIDYEIKVAANISGAFTGKVRAMIPVIIGWRFPKELQNIPSSFFLILHLFSFFLRWVIFLSLPHSCFPQISFSPPISSLIHPPVPKAPTGVPTQIQVAQGYQYVPAQHVGLILPSIID